MHADFELGEDGTVRDPRGGRREGSGRPKGYSPQRAKEIAEGTDPGDGTDVTSVAVRKSLAVADKAEADAKNAWLKYKVDSGEYLSRSAYREASATLLAELSQGLRSLPDTLERKYGLSPEVITHIQKAIDESMQTVADGLELFTSKDE